MLYARIPEPEYLTRARNTGGEAAVYPEWLKLLSTLPSTVSPSLVPTRSPSHCQANMAHTDRCWDGLVFRGAAGSCCGEHERIWHLHDRQGQILAWAFR